MDFFAGAPYLPLFSPMATAAPGRIRWFLVCWIALIGAVSYLDRVNFSIAGNSIAAEFHLDFTRLGLVFSAFSAGYGLFQLVGGWLADRFGPRRTLALGSLWWAAFTALTAAVPSGIARAVAVFCGVRFLLGAGEAVMYPSSNRWVASWIPTSERGLANGIIFAGVGAGAALTPPVITVLMTHLGWRASFGACAVVGILAGSAWFWMARDLPAQHSWVGERERRVIQEGVGSSDDQGKSSMQWRALLRSRDVWAITLSYFCYGYVAYIFFTWFFIYLTTVRGLDLKAGSYYATLPFIAMSVCSALGGWASDTVSRRFGRRAGRCGVAMLGLSGAAVFLLLGPRASSAAAVSVILAGGAGALYLSQSSYWALSADLGGKSSGMISGLMNMGAQTGSAITATLTPLVAKKLGWSAAFFVAAALCVVGALAWGVVRPNGGAIVAKPSESQYPQSSREES